MCVGADEGADVAEKKALQLRTLQSLMQSLESKIGGGEGVDGLYGTITMASLAALMHALQLADLLRQAAGRRDLFVRRGARPSAHLPCRLPHPRPPALATFSRFIHTIAIFVLHSLCLPQERGTPDPSRDGAAFPVLRYVFWRESAPAPVRAVLGAHAAFSACYRYHLALLVP